MKKTLYVLCLILISVSVMAQYDNTLFDAVPSDYKKASLSYAKTITKEDLKKHLLVLASDSLEGRETGELGQKKAAAYIKNHFQNQLNIPPIAELERGYYQPFPLSIKPPNGASLSVNGKVHNFQSDFYYFGRFEDQKITGEEVVFLGYGIDDKIYSNYKGQDIEDKILLIFDGVPKKIKKKNKSKAWMANWRIKIDLASKMGAKALLIIDEEFDANSEKLSHYIEKPYVKLATDSAENNIPVFYIRPEIAKTILNKSDEDYNKLYKKSQKKPSSEVLQCNIALDVKRTEKKVSSENVLGFIEGTDKKEEIIVLTAHYDHLGKINDKIFYGADDDGSGTAALMELAEAFSKAKEEGKGPRRSILIMPVAGEEKGLLGSRYYTEFPVFPLENTVVNLNIDMIGRLDPEHEGNPNYIYLIGSDKLSTELHLLSEETNRVYSKLELDYTYNDENDPNRYYYRSDHWNFAKNEIPVIFYFNGVHEDYHKETDTVDKIDFEKMEKITRLIFHTAWEVANREERISLDITQ